MASRSFKKKKNYAPGGMVEGPAHAESGVDAVVGQKPIAEIEGNERIFSKEDTKLMEQESQKILKAVESGDVESADKAALEFGYRVAEMLTKQDMRQSREEFDTQAINNFGNGDFEG